MESKSISVIIALVAASWLASAALAAPLGKLAELKTHQISRAIMENKRQSDARTKCLRSGISLLKDLGDSTVSVNSPDLVQQVYELLHQVQVQKLASQVQMSALLEETLNKHVAECLAVLEPEVELDDEAEPEPEPQMADPIEAKLEQEREKNERLMATIKRALLVLEKEYHYQAGATSGVEQLATEELEEESNVTGLSDEEELAVLEAISGSAKPAAGDELASKLESTVAPVAPVAPVEPLAPVEPVAPVESASPPPPPASSDEDQDDEEEEEEEEEEDEEEKAVDAGQLAQEAHSGEDLEPKQAADEIDADDDDDEPEEEDEDEEADEDAEDPEMPEGPQEPEALGGSHSSRGRSVEARTPLAQKMATKDHLTRSDSLTLK